MNKKGFTLIEMLAVIVIIGILGTIAFVSTSAVSKKNKEKIFLSKVDSIELVAVNYIQEHKNDYLNYSKPKDCIYLTIRDLYTKGYLKKDSSDASCVETTSCIEDPRDSSKYLDNYMIEIRLNNNKFEAKYVTSTQCQYVTVE